MDRYFVHDFSPYLWQFKVGPLSGISWYGLMYVFGFVAGYLLLARLRRRGFLPLPGDEHLQDLLTYCILGVLIGGRLGHVLFYSPGYYLLHPAEIFALWRGGMASHGGIAGLLVALVLFSRKHKIPLLALCDSAAMAATPGLFFGRLGNFINGEMPGKVTEVPWAVIFARNAEAGMLPRHPVQIYQALTEGLVLFVLLWFLLPTHRFKRGFHTAIFLIGYSVLRIGTEFFRETSPELAAAIGGGITQGQVLSTVMLICGAVVLWYTQKKLPQNTIPAWQELPKRS